MARARFAPIATIAALVVAVFSPTSPLRASPGDVYVHEDPNQWLPANGIVDERLWYYTRTGAFSANREQGLTPGARCDGDGIVGLRTVCGGLGRVGFEGCWDDHWIDPCGLTDAFISHQPIPEAAAWRIGHFMRAVPQGYQASVFNGRPMMNDPELDARFERTLLRVRAPLLDSDRLGLILMDPLGD